MKLDYIFRRENGMTLIEVLLSISILGIIIISIMAFFGQSFDYMKKNESKTVGINVARNVLYYIEQQDYQPIKDLYFNDPTTENVALTNTVCSKKTTDDIPLFTGNCLGFFNTTVNNVRYEATVKLSKPTDSDLIGAILPVEVTVQWPGQNHTATVRGILKK